MDDGSRRSQSPSPQPSPGVPGEGAGAVAADLLRRRQSGRVVYLPVRHHSPACALHVRQTIEQLNPSAVLVEGPADLTPLVPSLLHPDARPPFAVYTTYVDKGGRVGPTKDAAR